MRYGRPHGVGPEGALGVWGRDWLWGLSFVVGLTVLALLASGCAVRRPGGSSGPTTTSAVTTSETAKAASTLSSPTLEVTVAPPAAAPGTSSAEPSIPKQRDLVIAWQPSHQADTGASGWKEYRVCGDIVDRTIRELPEFKHVKAWDTKHGLTGSNNYRPKPSNTRAFDQELRIAGARHAEIFISIHNDGGAPSGILGEYLPGDTEGKALSESLVNALSHDLDMKDRGSRAVTLYSLESVRNKARYRCLLEVGDNSADREFLESPEGRQQVAESLARAIRQFDFEE